MNRKNNENIILKGHTQILRGNHYEETKKYREDKSPTSLVSSMIGTVLNKINIE